jgi:hypothetical protein
MISGNICIDLGKQLNMKFVGLEAGKECWGGDDTSEFSRNGQLQVEIGKCNAACADPDFTCGGQWALAVYKLAGEK